MNQVRAAVAAATLCAICFGVRGLVSAAQAPPARGTAPVQSGRGAAPRSNPARSAAHVDANLAQLMRGIVYPSSNVVFAAQEDLGRFPPVKDPATSPNPLTSTYGGWQAVESASLALAESSSLLLLPGRICSNGAPAPVTRADWVKFTAGLREAGLGAYKAAQSKNQDAIVDASGAIADSCSACHEVYRDKPGGPKSRCVP
jgi:cytochrome c553